MKHSILLLSMATALALVSCKTEPAGEDFGKKDLTIRASIAATKVSAESGSLSWTAGDGILVSCDGEAYNFTTAQGGSTAAFTTSDGLTQEKVGINPLTAYYGCTQFGAFTIPQNQTISGSESRTKLPMYAYTATAPEEATVSMTFTPAASLLEITVSPADITLDKVELFPVEETSVVGNVAGAGTVNAVTGKVTTSGNLKSISASFQGGTSLKNGLTFRMPVGWFSVTGGMKLVLTYNETNSYEEIIFADGTFESYTGSGDSKAFKLIPVNLEIVLGARDYYVSTDGKSSSKGLRESDPTTLDYALSSADEGSTIYLAAGTYNPVRNLQGDETGSDSHKTFEIARGLTLIGAGEDKTILDASGALHAVCVTALPEAKVIIKNLTIKGGDTSAAEEETETTGFVNSPVNEKKYSDSYGAGLYAIGADIELEQVTITGNKGKNAVGTYLNGAKAKFKNVDVVGNESTGNGTGMWVAASEITMDDCTVSNNKGEGVGAGLYIYSAAETACAAIVNNSVFEGNETSKNNCAIYVRGADATSDVSATFTACVIKENTATMGAGFGTTFASVLFDGCQILKNTSTGNGANLVYPGSKTSVKDCIFRENTAILAAAIYQYTNSDKAEMTVLNSEFSGNHTSGRGGAIYCRAGSASGTTLNVANSTFFGNESSSTGSAIAFVSDNAAYPTIGNIYSCTIVNNVCKRTSANAGGAVGIEKAGSTVHVYNSIISNNVWDANTDAANLYTVANSVAKAHKSVIGTLAVDADGVSIAGAPEFSAVTYLSKKEADGKTTVFSLVGNDNPAKTYGYDLAGLKALGASIEGSVLEKDQWGNARTGSMMGAYVE